MILIGGTELNKKELPFGDLIEYSIENNIEYLKIKLKMARKNGIYTKIYLNNKYIDINKDIELKIIEFTTDEELLNLINDSKIKKESNNLEEKNENIYEKIDINEVDIGEIEKGLNFTDIGGDVDISKINIKELERTIEDKNIILTDKNLEIEALIDEKEKTIALNKTLIEEYDEKLNTKIKEAGQLKIDITKLEEDNKLKIEEINRLNNDLKIKKEEIKNLKVNIKNMDNTIKKLIDDKALIIENQKKQLEELAESTKEKTMKANSIIEELTKKLEYEIKRFTPKQLSFLKYQEMAAKYNSFSKVEFPDSEKKELLEMKSKLHIFATGTDNSLSNLIPEVISLMNTKSLLIVDFSNDFYFKNAVFKVRDREHSLLLDKEGVKVESLVKEIGKSEYIATNVFNDIALLNVDWINIIRKVKEYANGKEIIFLFNSITSFSVRHTVTKLASIGTLQIFVNCNPMYLSNLLIVLKFLPKEIINLVVMKYIDITKNLIDILQKEYNLMTFNENISWNYLNL
ncbi:hypothetical protein Q3304_08400 [Clostridioides sp. GD02377]|uniref:hypothetical protein n=1 Tax=unclassified Clostridioides TaxID=2635829 RepID=UPI0038AF6EA9